MRLFHWTTRTYTKHVIIDQAYEQLDSLIDNLVETYLSYMSNAHMRASIRKVSMKCQVLTDAQLRMYLDRKRKQVSEFNFEQPDLNSIRDDILAVLSKTIYLFDNR